MMIVISFVFVVADVAVSIDDDGSKMIVAIMLKRHSQNVLHLVPYVKFLCAYIFQVGGDRF